MTPPESVGKLRFSMRLPRAALLLAIASGLSSPAQVGSQPPSPLEPTDAPDSEDGERARRAQVFARVGEVTLTLGDVEDELANLPALQRVQYQDPRRLREYAASLVRLELLSREAERRGFDEHAEVRKERQQHLVQQLLRREFGDATAPQAVTDEEIHAYYEAHPEQFSRPETRRAHHILLETEADARALLAELRGADLRRFRQLAQQRSLDTETKLRGGDLRYFTQEGRSFGRQTPGPKDDTVESNNPEDMGPAPGTDPHVDDSLVLAAFSLEVVGQVHPEPIPVAGKFSVLMLSGIIQASSESFEEAEEGIRLRLFRERRQARIDTFVQDIRGRVQPEIHPERLDPVRLESEREMPRTGRARNFEERATE